MGFAASSGFAMMVTRHLASVRDNLVSLHEREIATLRAEIRAGPRSLGHEWRVPCPADPPAPPSEEEEEDDPASNVDFSMPEQLPLENQAGGDSPEEIILAFDDAELPEGANEQPACLAIKSMASTGTHNSGLHDCISESPHPYIARAVLLQVWVSHFGLLKQKRQIERHEADRMSLRASSSNWSLLSASEYDTSGKLRMFKRSRFAIHPHSWKRLCWTMLSISFVSHDICMVPMDYFFDVTPHLGIIWCSRIFWSLDIVISALTGVYVNGTLRMDLERIAQEYAHGWLCFDVLLVLSEWVLMVMEFGGDVSSITLLRTVRVMRLARLWRMRKIKSALSDALAMSSDAVLLYFGVAKRTALLVIYFHLLAGVWYKVGNAQADGWVHDEIGMENGSTIHRYFVSLHFAMTQLHGTSVVQPNNTVEHILATCISFVSFVWMAHYLSQAVHTVSMLSMCGTAQVEIIGRTYVRTHNLPWVYAMRLKKFISAYCDRRGLCERMEQEAKLFAVLPVHLQGDLRQAVRGPIIARLPFLRAFDSVDTLVMRRLCQEAINDSPLLVMDVAFCTGEACVNAIFVDSGLLKYSHGVDEADVCNKEARVSEIMRKTGRTEFDPNILVRGQCLSEAALWTKWDHCGQLYAVQDSSLLLMDAAHFARVIEDDDLSCIRAVEYGRKFVWKLNHEIEEWSDVTEFDINFNTSMTSARDDEHLMFLSHFKEEAGTEATLMCDALESLILQDSANPAGELMSPVFIDTKDLKDLGQLRHHVTNSQYLVILLTPGLLSRPWCLMEIVTAVENDVAIVPVEIQRPGARFSYPDDNFYTKLVSGHFLPFASLHLLEDEGIFLADLERALRQVFKNIAIPFSPHKSANIRQAELADILRRCRWQGDWAGKRRSRRHSLRSQTSASSTS